MVFKSNVGVKYIIVYYKVDCIVPLTTCNCDAYVGAIKPGKTLY